MKTRRKLSCYCVTSGTVEQDVSILGPWYPVSSDDVHLKTRPGRLEDATRVSKYGQQRKPKHCTQSHVTTKQTRNKVEYHFSHLSPEDYISSYRDCCSSVSRQGESTVTNEKVKRLPIEVTSILLESPLPLKDTQSHTRPAQQSVPFTEHWSSTVSTAGIKSDGLTQSHKDDIQVIIDNKGPKPLAIMTSFKYVVTNEFPFYKSDNNLTSGKKSSVNRYIDNKLLHSKDHTHRYSNHKDQSHNVLVSTKEHNTLFKDVVSPAMVGNKDAFGRLLTARLKAISDYTIYKDPSILNTALVSKRLQPSTNKMEDINIPTVTSTPNVLQKTLQHHLIPYHNCLLINSNDSFDEPVLRSSVSARVKHRLSLIPSSATVRKGQSHKPHQMTCFKKSLRRHLSTGKWLFLDRKTDISKSEERPTLDDILNAE